MTILKMMILNLSNLKFYQEIEERSNLKSKPTVKITQKKVSLEVIS